MAGLTHVVYARASKNQVRETSRGVGLTQRPVYSHVSRCVLLNCLDITVKNECLPVDEMQFLASLFFKRYKLRVSSSPSW